MSKIYTVPELQSVLSPIFRANGVRKATLFALTPKAWQRHAVMWICWWTAACGA